MHHKNPQTQPWHKRDPAAAYTLGCLSGCACVVLCWLAVSWAVVYFAPW